MILQRDNGILVGMACIHAAHRSVYSIADWSDDALTLSRLTFFFFKPRCEKTELDDESSNEHNDACPIGGDNRSAARA